jgi:peptidoglycan/xylan/chitin deacetylase (PgdA/CDA1 family)
VRPLVQLSFDIEEFDMPLEYGYPIDSGRQLALGREGLERIQPLLGEEGLRTTLFTTAHFADTYPDDIRALARRHEIASHTYYHSRYETEHLATSRSRLEEVAGVPVRGLRMPRMRQVSMSDIAAAGYAYDASVHPTWLPGRYNNLHMPRAMYRSEGMIRVPASVTPWFRLPLFWLAFKNYPYRVYLHLCRRVLEADGYLSLYYHPWEFTDVRGYGLPGYTVRGCEGWLLERLHRLVDDLQREADFVSMDELVARWLTR